MFFFLCVGMWVSIGVFEYMVDLVPQCEIFGLQVWSAHCQWGSREARRGHLASHPISIALFPWNTQPGAYLHSTSCSTALWLHLYGHGWLLLGFFIYSFLWMLGFKFRYSCLCSTVSYHKLSHVTCPHHRNFFHKLLFYWIRSMIIFKIFKCVYGIYVYVGAEHVWITGHL